MKGSFIPILITYKWIIKRLSQLSTELVRKKESWKLIKFVLTAPVSLLKLFKLPLNTAKVHFNHLYVSTVTCVQSMILLIPLLL